MYVYSSGQFLAPSDEHSLRVSCFYYCNLFVESRNVNGTPALWPVPGRFLYGKDVI